MDPIEKRELKRQAWMRLAAQRRRAGLLRGRVVVLSLVCFAALWGVVFTQMATGNDPVLSAKEKVVATRSASTSARREVETSDPRELEPERRTDSKARTSEEEAEPVEAEPEVEEEAEPVAAEPEVEESEPEVVEEAEPEPLVTSQS
jgi:non-ribosomal peptide synthetase component E (peptide arylation enzyme)